MNDTELTIQAMIDRGLQNAMLRVGAWRDVVKAIVHFIETTEKAYGGCRKCYGKGYATYRHGLDYGHVVEKSRTRIIPCTCERGKDLGHILKGAKTPDGHDILGIGIT